MEKYHKIQTMYMRDPDFPKRLLVGLWSRPEFGYLANNIWIWTEKIDGTNIRLIWDGQALQAKGKSNEAQVPPHLLDALNLDTLKARFTETFGEQPATLYGEGYGPKIQKGDKYRDTPGFILFDVFCGGLWLERENVHHVAGSIGVEVVPIVGEGSLYAALGVVRKGLRSQLAPCMAEGLVLRPKVEMLDRRGERIITKIKARDLVESGIIYE